MGKGKKKNAGKGKKSAVNVYDDNTLNQLQGRAMTTEVESSSKLLCVICRCDLLDPEFLLDNFHIFVVDLNDADGTKGYVKMAPNLRLQGFTGCTTVCNVDLDLYFFDITKDRNVYKYTINDGVAALKSKIVVQDPKMMVTKVPYPKLGLPRAIPTPDGRIVVLSSMAYFYGSGSDALNEEFVEKSHPELYDPKTNVWKLLPELCIRPSPISRPINCPISRGFSPGSINFEVLDNSSGSWTTFAEVDMLNYNVPSFRQYSVHECCFISESTLLVRIMSKYFRADGHLVTLNIHSLDQGWKSFDGWEFCKLYPGRFLYKMLVFGNRLFVDAQGGVDISSKSPVNVKFPRSDFSRMAHEMAVTDYVEDKECCFANVFSRPSFGPGEAYLVVDEFKYDFTQGICTAKIKAPFFFITALRTELFFVCKAFMLPPAPKLFKDARKGRVLDDPEIGIQSRMQQQKLEKGEEKDSIFEGVGARSGIGEMVSLEEDCRY